MNNANLDDLNYSLGDGSGKKGKRNDFHINMGQIEKEKMHQQNTERFMYDSRGQFGSARNENDIKQAETQGSEDKIQMNSLNSQKDLANFGEIKGLATPDQV